MVMHMQLFNRGGLTLVAALGFGVSTSASALSLDTTYLQANSTLQFSASAYNATNLLDISFSTMGNAYQSGSVTTGNTSVPTFVLPVTNADVSIGWNLKISPNSGEAIGSGLLLTRGYAQLGLANFAIDYTTDKVYADVMWGGKSTNMAVYSFTEQTDLKIGLNGLALTMNQTLGNLKLTGQAVDTFASVLGVDDLFKGVMSGLNFGTITIDIKTALRKPISDNPLTAASMVPETSTYVMMAMGLAGIAVLRRSKRAA
jgi:hypothetical protein